MKKRRRKKRRSNKSFIRISQIMIGIILVVGIIIAFNQYRINKDKIVYSNDVVNGQSSDSDNQSNEITAKDDNKGVPVLCFHSISDDSKTKSSIVIPKDKLKQDLQAVKDYGYTTLTMAQLNDYLFNNKPIPKKSVVISFDDGYKDNYTNAFPILKELNMNATIFVISSYLDGQVYMTPDEVKELSNYGIDIESHTVDHKQLSTLSYDEQYKELKDSKDSLEKLIGKPVTAIAYPEGKYNDDTQKAAVEAGYSMGFTIERGYADRDDSRVLLNRICIDYTYKPSDIKKVLENLRK